MMTLTLLLHSYGGEGFHPGFFALHPAMLWLGLILLFAARRRSGRGRHHRPTAPVRRPERAPAPNDSAGDGPLWPDLYRETEKPAQPKREWTKDDLI